MEHTHLENCTETKKKRVKLRELESEAKAEKESRRAEERRARALGSRERTIERSSKKEHRVDAKALIADEGRG